MIEVFSSFLKVNCFGELADCTFRAKSRQAGMIAGLRNLNLFLKLVIDFTFSFLYSDLQGRKKPDLLRKSTCRHGSAGTVLFLRLVEANLAEIVRNIIVPEGNLQSQ